MAATGLEKFGIRLIILMQLLIGNSDSRCDNIDFENFSPCEFKPVLTVTQGPCNVLIPDTSVAKDKPGVTLENAEDSKQYILLMLDPDAPDPDNPTARFYVHWLAKDIPGSGFKKGEIEGFEYPPYEPPTPPIGVHRYQFFVFEQPTTFDSSTTPRGRSEFNLNHFVSRNNLCDNLKASYQYYATQQYTVTGTVIMVSDGKFTIILGATTAPKDSGHGDDPSAPKDSTTATPTDSGRGGPDDPSAPVNKTTETSGSGIKSLFFSRVDKIKFLLLSFCVSYAYKPSC